MEFHNFILKEYYKEKPIDISFVRDDILSKYKKYRHSLLILMNI